MHHFGESIWSFSIDYLMGWFLIPRKKRTIGGKLFRVAAWPWLSKRTAVKNWTQIFPPPETLLLLSTQPSATPKPVGAIADNVEPVYIKSTFQKTHLNQVRTTLQNGQFLSLFSDSAIVSCWLMGILCSFYRRLLSTCSTPRSNPRRRSTSWRCLCRTPNRSSWM